jgi:hypothetical protein
MNPRSRLFNVSTFVSDEAAGLYPVSRRDLATVVAAMEGACYGPTFQPGRCAALSQMVGRIRMQNKCLESQGGNGPTTAGSVLATATSTAEAQTNAKSTLLSAVAALGAQQPPTGPIRTC